MKSNHAQMRIRLGSPFSRGALLRSASVAGNWQLIDKLRKVTTYTGTTLSHIGTMKKPNTGLALILLCFGPFRSVPPILKAYCV